MYWCTMAPGVTFIDSGELAAVASTLGIAHPSGYPLFTLLGWLFCRLPFGSEEIVRLNLMAAVCSAAAAGVFVRAFSRLALMKTRTGEERVGVIAALAGSLLLAFSETFWSEALAVEVYSLQLLLLAIILVLFFRANYLTGHEEHREHWWYAFAFAVGLGFTNHMTTFLLAPGLLYLYFSEQGSGKSSWLRLASLIPAFVAGISVYLYLPLRAAQSPVMNWGLVTTPERFWRHLTGRQYSIWMFSSLTVAKKQLSYFLSTYGSEFAYGGVILAAAGLVSLLRSHRHLALGLIILLLSSVLYAINYDIHDIDAYFLQAYVVTAMLATVGMVVVYRWICHALEFPPVIAGTIILLAGLLPLPVHFRSIDQSGNHLVEDYTMNMFASLPHDAVIFSYQWDYWVSASMYFQLVRDVRPDVVVIDQELLRRSWYLKELETWHPWLVAASRREVDAFLKEVDRFERGLPYDGEVIQRSYEAMIASFILHSSRTRQVFVTAEIAPEYTRGWNRVPIGLAFVLRSDTAFVSSPEPEFFYRPFLGTDDDLIRTVPRLYANAYLSRAEYYFRFRRDREEAQKNLEKALRLEPSSARARLLEILLEKGG
jgi:tetratricopeptide (TPR) repeat protein